MIDAPKVEMTRRLKRALDHVTNSETQARQAENYGYAKQPDQALQSAGRAWREAENAQSELRKLKRLIDML